jgi:hypothetical protein
METFTASYTMTPQLMRRMSRAANPLFWYGRWVAVGLFALSAILTNPWYWVSAAIIAVFSVASARWAIRPYGEGSHEITLTFSEEQYRSGSAANFGGRAWTGYRSVSRRGDFWVLRISPLHAVCFPASALTEGQSGQLVALLQRKGLARV